MRILILVLSYTEPPYDALMKAQWETWGATGNNVDVVYYTGSGTIRSVKGNINGVPSTYQFYTDFQEPCSDEYFQMHWKLKRCLDSIQTVPYDFVFRTNSSSYVNKEELLKFAETLPKEKCYAGWSLGEKEAVSGAGIWLSPDMVEILRNELPAGENIEEDILIGRILHGKHGIEIQDHKTRYDVGFAFDSWDIPDDAYHFRFKSTNRLKDVENMRRVHDILQSRKLNK